jgi:hypothetical protein
VIQIAYLKPYKFLHAGIILLPGKTRAPYVHAEQGGYKA